MTPRHAVKIPAGEEPAEPLTDAPFSLQWLQGCVGGYIEIVRVSPQIVETIARRHGLDFMRHAPPESQVVLVVNEEGRLRGLPFNPLASLLAGQTIVGPAVLCAVD